MKKIMAFLGVGVLTFLYGCVAPEVTTSNQISPDADPLQGGISSADIRSVASQMAPSILALPEIAEASDLTRIKIADFKNNSRFFIDSNLFMKRLVLELNRHGKGQVRFLNNNEKIQKTRIAALKDRQAAQLQENLKNIAADLAKSPVAATPIKVAVIPVLNTNLVNMNADSFTAMLRSEIVNSSAGRIQFLMPGITEGADYYLTGQFIPETMKTEGIINLAEYIQVVDSRVKNGQSMYIVNDMANGNVPSQITTVQHGENISSTTITPATNKIAIYETHLKNILNNPELRNNPDVNKRLNIMLVDAKTKTAVFEKMILVDRKISDNSGSADYIISGEINGMHQRKNGTGTDYLMVTIQLVEIDSGETIWEDAYEVKRISSSGIVYK
ncbi:MAG: hypothetical protein IKD09_02730 [Lentisphaeria bacterium]|nr:hypothetical protein [Lentisphaeria bacterium]